MKHINFMNPDDAFASVEKMLYKVAWRASLKYGIPFEECKSECYFAFVKAYNWRYDPTKGAKFSTCVQNIAQWRMKGLVLGRMEEAPYVELNEEMCGAAPAERAESLELVDDLSSDAKEILSLILETPAEILGEAPVPARRLVGKIKRYLRQYHGRHRKDLDRAHEELATRFQEAWA